MKRKKSADRRGGSGAETQARDGLLQPEGAAGPEEEAVTDRDTEEATTLVYAIRAIEEKRLRGEETASVSHAQQVSLVMAAFGRVAGRERVRCATTDHMGGRRGPS